jgi:hypothetical protein
MIFWEIVGWLGTALYLLGYALLAFRIVSAGRVYFLLNVFAAAFVAAISVAKGSVQAVFVHGLWSFASVYGVCGIAPPLLGLRPPVVRVVVVVLVVGGLAAMPWAGLAVSAGWMAWGSVVGYTGAYVLFAGGRMAVLEFHIVNLVASAAILLVLVLDANWPTFTLEFVWMIVAAAGIVVDIAASRRGREKDGKPRVPLP